MLAPAVKRRSSSRSPTRSQMNTRNALQIPDLPAEVAKALHALRDRIAGEVRTDDVHRALYATDASMYEVVPFGVVMPRTHADVVEVVRTCRAWGIPLTARSAGTSLAGQAVGPGVVVDVGRYMTAVEAIDPAAREARVQPGVIRDDLNRRTAPHGLLFGPDTSTSNRAMIGGMIGNNSCGSQSIWYGTTRDNVRALDIVTLDGRSHHVGRCDRVAWAALLREDGLLGDAVRTLDRIVRANAAAIRDASPKAAVSRRNTGYPLDDLANTWLGHNPERDPDLARFFCGTEGTLALTTSAVLKLSDAPRAKLLVAAHFASIDEAMRATVEIVQHRPAAVELMDKRILDLSLLNPEQEANRWFVEGDPGAILVIEFYADTLADARASATGCIAALRRDGLGSAFPVLEGAQMHSVWELRKAGLGVLMGKPGDIKPITIVEDTAVAVEDLPAFIRDFAGVMTRHSADCVYYAHASVGEIHLRPELNPKLASDVVRAKAIAEEVAELVRHYRGSLSGEHGDGRLRGPYLERVLGAELLGWHHAVKDALDPEGLLNPGSMLRTKPMDADWRFHGEYRAVEFETAFTYERFEGFQRAVEACNGAGACRKPAEAGGTMCPSYMVTQEERESTRGRANLFRRLIQGGPDALFGSAELADALELCISCKGCKRDCPASVDMATLKAEFQQGRMDRHGRPLAGWAFANATTLAAPAQWLPGGAALGNALQSSRWGKRVMAALLGLAPERTLPAIAARGFHAQWRAVATSALPAEAPAPDAPRVLLFIDEFTDRYEPELGVLAARLLTQGGAHVVAPRLGPSGRTHLSKGFVRDARRQISANLERLAPYVVGDRPVDWIAGIEPSAALTYLDESVQLGLSAELQSVAEAVAQRVTLVEDVVVAMAHAGSWQAAWSAQPRSYLVHGHCHQKALVGVEGTRAALALAPGATVEVVPSGCCGMAGSFGYEAKHFAVSQAIGELVLFPAVRGAGIEQIVVAPGTSCRHQIADGTGRSAIHPVEALFGALRAAEVS